TDGQPAAGWNDADLTRPLHTSPVDHGFDYARFTSRSHGTSGPGAGKAPRRRNGPAQGVGPGHIHDRTVVGATGNGRKLVAQGPRAYILNRLGSRHSDHAAEFLSQHVTDENTRTRPFFLYYPANSNHGPYTPDTAIADRPVAGAARTESGQPMDARHDFIYENDVVLGRLLDWLESTDDPRRPGHRLLDNTVVIFTSDNGAEKNSNIATGPFRSHKGSVYEGGHRVPFIVSWPAGGIGNSDAQTPGLTNPAPIGLQDLYATFADILSVPLPNLRNGQKGAEDSHSVLAAFRGQALPDRPPLFFNDHKEATQDHAAAAIRIDNPEVAGHTIAGQWKLFFDAGLLRTGTAHPVELFDLAVDLQEQTNLIDRPDLQPLLSFMTSQAVLHRTSGGHRAVRFAGTQRAVFTLSSDSPSRGPAGQAAAEATLTTTRIPGLLMTLSGVQGDTTPDGMVFTATAEGLGLSGGGHGSVNAGEALLIRFNRDVVVESAALVAGTGTCGGYCRAGTAAPVAIYCVDADIDAQDQSGILSDLGVLQAGSPLRLDSRPHFGVEDAGQWRLKSLTVRAAN
ncbi:MAG: sulfatase-like hydrolase/transferase, partial [Planctomycetaceae bacterium]